MAYLASAPSTDHHSPPKKSLAFARCVSQSSLNTAKPTRIPATKTGMSQIPTSLYGPRTQDRLQQPKGACRQLDGR